ncbi:MAG TPA: ATP-binding cassette domain-containing protein, partial [Longimicrobiales bacterium]|nr:ATP-binding cassette domain-containing protein [Longimicrobiales bacterium]
MIRFQGLTKRYGPLTAVRDLTLEVRPGEVVALLGPNGAGKTTALRCLATLLAPTAGTVSVFGADAVGEPLEVRRRIAFLAASMGLYER